MHRPFILATALLAISVVANAQTPDTLYDIVIRNGRVLDGQGNPWIAADVAIKDGRFVKVGRVARHGKTELDARGKYVSPGWIDAMDQSGSVLPRNGLAENKLREGVTTAIGGEGKEVVQAVGEAIAIGERAGMPVEVFHLKVAYQPGWGILMDSVRAEIEAARARGVDVAADMYVYTAGGTGLEATIPSWAHEGGADSLRARLANPAIRARLKNEITTGSPGWWNIIEAAGGWDGIVLVNARNPANKKYENKTIAQIAKEMGKDPADAAFDLVSQGQERVMAIYHMMGEQDIETALRFPWTSIGSDAGAILKYGEPDETGLPHPRSFGNFPRVIARYVKERKVLTLEDAIRKMTSWPATRMRLAHRGAIREGNWADVTIFDLDQLQDKATYESPMEFPTGIEWVLVNGVVTVDHGRHTGAKAGQVMRGAGWVREPSKS